MSTRACMLIHGFTGGPYELGPLADHLRKRGVLCTVPELPGHGGKLRELKRYTRADWIAKALTEAEKLVERCGPIDLVGFSMGGLLATYVANRLPVRRLALLGTPVIYISPGRMIRDIAERLAGSRTKDTPGKAGTPVRAVVEFMKLVKEIRPEFEQVSVPTLIVQGAEDHIVHPYSAKYIYEKISAPKELLILPNSRHLLCFGEEADRLFGEVEQFLQY